MNTHRRLKSINYSSNRIFDQGIEAISALVGENYKAIQKLKFKDNCVTDYGFRKLLQAIEKRDNKISELSFVENDLTDESGFFLYQWLKRLRMQDVGWSMNVIVCDISLNKVLYKTLKEVEGELAVNYKFMLDRKKVER